MSKEWSHWLAGSCSHSNGGQLILMLSGADQDELYEAASLVESLGIDFDTYHSDPTVEMAVRNFNLIPTFIGHSDAFTKKWFILCDDDTFFPSMHGLLDMLGAHDHTAKKNMGALSENPVALDTHGAHAYGGAGIFLWFSMARHVTEIYAACTNKIDEYDIGFGVQSDVLLRNCIYKTSDVRLTGLQNLWQLDLYGHPSGFYEWGIKPLSLHHYRGDGWHFAKPPELSTIAHMCGEDCIMLRFRTVDNYIVSGYSVAYYLKGITFDTAQTEGTLYGIPKSRTWNLDYVFGPQRPSLIQTGRKIAWELQKSNIQSDGSVLQTYTRRWNESRWTYSDGRYMSKSDGVIDLVWLPA